MKSIPTMIDGQTSLDADDFNQIPDELENAITGSGQTLSDSDLNQLGKSLTRSSCLYNYYQDSGSVNSIILNSVNHQPLQEYVDGLQVRFYTSNTSTGNTTVNIDGLGSKSIVNISGTELSQLSIIANNYYGIIYNASIDKFILLSPLTSNNLSDIGSCIISPNGDIYSGYLEANGAAISRTIYSELFSVYGTFFGIGDGSTTFNLPDYQGLFLRGFGGNSDAIGILQDDEFKSHSHSSTAALIATGGNTLGGGTSAIDNRNIPTNNVGGVETRPMNKAVIYLVKYI